MSKYSDVDYDAPHYPKKDFENDERRVLSQDEIKELRRIRADEGLSYRKLGDLFDVSKTTARYHCLDQQERDKINQKRYQLLQEQYEENPEKLQEKQDDWNKRWKKRVKNDEDAREFKQKRTYLWKKRRYHSDKDFQEKVKKQSRDRYNRKREEEE